MVRVHLFPIMVALARLAWLRGHMLSGRRVSLHVSHSAESGKDKVRFLLHPATSGSDVVSPMLLSAIALVADTCAHGVVVDRGHQHSKGLSEICFWIQKPAAGRTMSRRPAALNADAAPFVPSPPPQGVPVSVTGAAVLSEVKTHLRNFALGASNSLSKLIVLTSQLGDKVVALERLVASIGALSDALAGQAAVGPAPVAAQSFPRSDALAVGDTVWIKSLNSRPELNGTMATVLKPLDDSGRVGVLVAASELFGRQESRIRVKPEKLRFSAFAMARHGPPDDASAGRVFAART